MICRVVDTVTSALGILAGPGIGFAIVGGFGMALSVLAIVLLVRLSPARALRHTATSLTRRLRSLHAVAAGPDAHRDRPLPPMPQNPRE